LWTLACNTIFLYFRQSLAAARPILFPLIVLFSQQICFFLPNPQPGGPGSVFVWNLTLDLSGMGDLPVATLPPAELLRSWVLRPLPRRPLIHLTHLFNHCIRLSHFPTYWKEAKVITLPKPGKDPKFP
jgi:hypothetical protein